VAAMRKDGDNMINKKDFNIGDRVRIRKMPVIFVGPFNHQDTYIVSSYFGLPYIFSENKQHRGMPMMDLNDADVIIELVDTAPQQIMPPTLEEKPKPEPTEAERMMMFFKASAHDPNARW
jgi:hypothetical protein